MFSCQGDLVPVRRSRDGHGGGWVGGVCGWIVRDEAGICKTPSGAVRGSSFFWPLLSLLLIFSRVPLSTKYPYVHTCWTLQAERVERCGEARKQCDLMTRVAALRTNPSDYRTRTSSFCCVLLLQYFYLLLVVLLPIFLPIFLLLHLFPPSSHMETGFSLFLGKREGTRDLWYSRGTVGPHGEGGGGWSLEAPEEHHEAPANKEMWACD